MLFRQIEYFQAVVECGNFYRAAERCCISQSAISQQVRKLEQELGVQLLDRHNRTFSLTPAGTHFYQKSLVITGDLEQLVRETRQLDRPDSARLRLGYYRGYTGSQLTRAVAAFSQSYPAVEIQVQPGSHESLYRAMEKDTVDLAINDQRRAFSGAYHNLVLAESRTCIEIANRHPLSRLAQIETDDLKNTPCILVTDPAARAEEQAYYEKIVGLRGDFLFADTMEAARLMVITGQGYLPVDLIGEQTLPDATVSRIPLVRRGEPVTKTYCAFWKRDNSGYYIETFARLLKGQFSPQQLDDTGQKC